MNKHRPFAAIRQSRESGFSLVELMIGSAIGLIILAALSYVLVGNVQSRNELEKGSRQLESGRYALSSLGEDIQLAGFYGEFFPNASMMTTPDPCALALKDMGFADAGYGWNTGNPSKVPVGIFGYAGSTAPSTECAPLLTNRKAGTDILVIRRAGTTPVVIDADGNNAADANVTLEDGSSVTYASLANGHYLQASNCSEIGAAAEFGFVMDHDTSKFTLHKAIRAGSPAQCTNGTLSNVRRYMVRIFYVSTCNDCTGGGDGIPTLKMLELTPQATECAANATSACGEFVERALADGIENLQLEYGIDTNLDGTPDSFVEAPTSNDWENAIAVRIFLLARNIEKTRGYVNNKKYVLNSTGTLVHQTADEFKRHLYSATVRATNLAGRRQ